MNATPQVNSYEWFKMRYVESLAQFGAASQITRDYKEKLRAMRKATCDHTGTDESHRAGREAL